MRSVYSEVVYLHSGGPLHPSIDFEGLELHLSSRMNGVHEYLLFLLRTRNTMSQATNHVGSRRRHLARGA